MASTRVELRRPMAEPCEASSGSALYVAVRETRGPGHVRRTLTIDDDQETFFEISGNVLPPPIELYDFAALSTFFLAMRQGRPLHIDGPVSSTLLRNLEELQEVWAAWRPSTYTPIPITAAEERTVAAHAPESGVFAFSGGVDGTAALLRHYTGDLNRREVRPVAAVMIHGFDIPRADTAAFETARDAAIAMLKELDLPLCVVRTNWRETICRRWEMEYTAGLAACLHQFAGAAVVGVVGGGEDYAHLDLPWGSNPITNPMLSGGAFAIQTECNGLTRTERVALICKFPEVAAKLRVCWEGPVTGGNCGRCEKCIRTKLNFLAAGYEPLGFDGRPTQMQILGIPARNVVQIAFLEEILASAKKNGVEDRWLAALSASIVKNKALRPFRPIAKRAKGRVVRAWKSATFGRTNEPDQA
ncbi:MAG: hypothetical protein GEU87_14595 [Alphaproteobacteria bacterium]|nr:hypothetical protein [Alphaproteobacteria bacterium]